jgi:hypothetical protein
MNLSSVIDHFFIPNSWNTKKINTHIHFLFLEDYPNANNALISDANNNLF